MKKLTLDKILQTQGFGTRKECRNLILHGAVGIGDEIVTDYGATPDTQDLTITVDGEPWLYREHLYIAINKPAGVECSRRPAVHRGVLSLLPDQFTVRDVQPVGRLDHDTTGLLLLSDDGTFIHAQSSPKRHVTKTYVATTQEPVTPELVAQLQTGVKLTDEPAPLAARARQLDTHQIEIILDQGKYHQVRRMLVAAGNHCVALRRTAIGGLTLEALGLAEGAWCYLDAAQTALLKAV
ncbi:MAG: pseudouridine synthase [Rhodocyclaceae bacterium]|nr:pseudouridine synthase [Rhodocyclaceae bacterium]